MRSFPTFGLIVIEWLLLNEEPLLCDIDIGGESAIGMLSNAPLDLTNPFSSVVQFNNARFRKQARSESAIGVLRNALDMCKKEGQAKLLKIRSAV